MIVLAEELHFGRAAERLNIAQPALTQQIQVLERELGARLFQRTKRSVKLTTAGRLTLDEAHRTIQQADRTFAIARQAGRGQIGFVEIGYVGSAAFSGVLSNVIFPFRAANPSVELRLNELSIRQQLEDISTGCLDVGFIRVPVMECPDGVAFANLLREQIILALPQEHPLARMKRISMNRLTKEPFIAVQVQEGVGFDAKVKSICLEASMTPQVAHRAQQFAAVVSLVGAGLGVAFVPASLRNLQVPNVVYRPLAGIAETSTLALAFRRSDPSPAVNAFIVMAKKSAINRQDAG